MCTNFCPVMPEIDDVLTMAPFLAFCMCGMTKAAAVQFAEDGIRVNSVHPGLMPPMRTSMLSADPGVRNSMLKAIPMARTGEVDEVAHAYLFLASDDASYITGVELPVDGGYLAM